MPVRIAGALRTRRGVAHRRHSSDQPARCARSPVASSQGERARHPYVDRVTIMADALTTKRVVRAAAVQIAPDFEPPNGTLDRVCTAIDEAAAKGVQLIVFPETFVPYYPN